MNIIIIILLLLTIITMNIIIIILLLLTTHSPNARSRILSLRSEEEEALSPLAHHCHSLHRQRLETLIQRHAHVLPVARTQQPPLPARTTHQTQLAGGRVRGDEESERRVEAERPARGEGTTGVRRAERRQLRRRLRGEQEEVQGGGGNAQEQM